MNTAPLTLEQFFSTLDNLVTESNGTSPSRETLESLLPRLRVSRADLERNIQFNKDRYQRNLVHEGPKVGTDKTPAYQALALCWRSGQRSPIHDHQGSACAVRIIEGIATETLFERAPNGMVHGLFKPRSPSWQ